MQPANTDLPTRPLRYAQKVPAAHAIVKDLACRIEEQMLPKPSVKIFQSRVRVASSSR